VRELKAFVRAMAQQTDNRVLVVERFEVAGGWAIVQALNGQRALVPAEWVSTRASGF
jgi:hypothetical protein